MPRIPLNLIAASLTALAADHAMAAAITYGTPTTISGDSDVSTNGTSIAAYDLGGSGATTVNTVTFTGTGPGTNNTFTNAFGGFNNAPSPTTPFTNLSPALQTLLATGDYFDQPQGSPAPTPPIPANATLTFGGLTVGQAYEVQLFVNDSRSCCGFRTEVVDGAVTLDYGTSGTAGGIGQFVTGTFTADATSQVIALSAADADVQLNAAQLRSVPEPGCIALFVAGTFGLLARRRRA